MTAEEAALAIFSREPGAVATARVEPAPQLQASTALRAVDCAAAIGMLASQHYPLRMYEALRKICGEDRPGAPPRPAAARGSAERPRGNDVLTVRRKHLCIRLLHMPPQMTIPQDTLDQITPAMMEFLQGLAVRMEILDPREVRYILARREDLGNDLGLLNRRRSGLEHAPPVGDCLRFPERVVINDLLAFNRAYRQHIDVRQPVELVQWWDLRAALQEVDRLYQVWDTVRDARCEYYYVTVRRQALKRLREMIGEEAYYGGNLPACVPLGRFRAVD